MQSSVCSAAYVAKRMTLYFTAISCGVKRPAVTTCAPSLTTFVMGFVGGGAVYTWVYDTSLFHSDQLWSKEARSDHAYVVLNLCMGFVGDGAVYT